MRQSSVRLIYAALFVMGIACRSDGGKPPEPEVFNVGPQGDSITLANGLVVIVVPPGAVTEPTTVTATPVDGPAAATLVPGTVYDIQPSLTLLVPAKVTIHYGPANLPAGVNESELSIYKVVNNAWSKVPGTVLNTTAKTLTVSLSSFSTYGILGAPVATVAVTPPTASINVGDTTRLAATVTDADGTTLPNRAVSWQSSATGKATINSGGLVTAVAAGSATMTATSETVNGQSAITVTDTAGPPPPPPPPPATLASHTFNDSTLGPFFNPWGNGITLPSDPTNTGHGRVARILYSPGSGGSMERAVAWIGTGAGRLRYGQTLWFRGRVYFASGTGNYNGAHNRKILDYQGGGARVTPHRVGATREMKISIVDWMNGSEQEVMDPSTGIFLLDDTWYTIEMMVRMNSADNVRDGRLEVYINGAATPNFTISSGLGWITEKFPGGSYFDTYLIGFQLTINSGDPTYTDTRYWDDIAFGTTRIGP